MQYATGDSFMFDQWVAYRAILPSHMGFFNKYLRAHFNDNSFL